MESFKCPQCDGRGWNGYTTITFTNCRIGKPVQEHKCKRMCTLCGGKKEIDWVTKITKKERFIPGSIYCDDIPT